MTITLVGVFDTLKEAQQARSRLQTDGVADASIRVESSNNDASSASNKSATAHSSDDVDRRSFWDKLFGRRSDDDDAAGRISTRNYDEAMQRGNALLMVRLDDPSRVDRISDLLEQCGAVDVDERAAQWRSTGYDGPAHETAPADSSVDGDQTMQSIEEQLKVGKKTVQRGRVRIHSSTSERPVEEQVTLHKERVRVERKPVDRAATEADLSAAFKDHDIELTETDEEAVVAKTARVVEEVHVRTEATDRVETVRETVRKTEIDVDKSDDKSTPNGGGAAPVKLTDSGTESKRGAASGGLAGSAGASHRKGKEGYGGAERRKLTNVNYSGRERRMAAV